MGTTRSAVSTPPRPDSPPLSPLEIAAGVIGGRGEGLRPLPFDDPELTPLEALERAVLAGLERPPCCVSFSGGRDSSLVLAVATRVARERGLEPPVPVTNVVVGAPKSDESEWQRLVLRHLEVADWVRLRHEDELDLLGPVAAGVLRRHGLLFPFNAFFHVPIYAAAAGGSVLTGVGGDECLDGVTRLQCVLARRLRPGPRDLARLAALALPAVVRRALLARRHRTELPWLTRRANRSLSALVAETADHSFATVGRGLERFWASRHLQEFLRGQRLLAAEADALALSPLAEPAFLAALARHLRRTSPRSRSAVLASCFPGLLPAELERRRTKASFNEVFWRAHSRRFAASIIDEQRLRALVDSAGLGGVVDVDGLAAAWREPEPHANSYLLLQALWLRAQVQSPA